MSSTRRFYFSFIILIVSIPFLKSLLSFQSSKAISANRPLQLSRGLILKQSVDEDDDFELMRSSIDSLLLSEDKANVSEIKVAAIDDSTSSSSSSSSFKPRTITAVISILLGSLIFAFQSTQQVSGVALLKQMEKESVPLQVIKLFYSSHSIIYLYFWTTNRPLSVATSLLSLNFMQIGAKVSKY